MSVMILALSLMSLIFATTFACAAQRVPAHSVRLEQWGGTLFVSGLTLLGAALPQLCYAIAAGWALLRAVACS
jgi:hypothetical protein